MSTELEPVVSFNDHTTLAFLEWIQQPEHVNRF